MKPKSNHFQINGKDRKNKENKKQRKEKGKDIFSSRWFIITDNFAIITSPDSANRLILKDSLLKIEV